jgi:hypothetical protein
MRGPGVHDSGYATCATDVPTLPTALLASPSGRATATDTAYTSAITVGEGRTSGTSS